MDEVTLAYLTNPAYFREIAKRSTSLPSDFDEDIHFYRRRLISLYKDLLSGEKINDSVNDAHDEFVQVAIAHFKQVDRQSILQKEYIDVCDSNEGTATNEGDAVNHVDATNEADADLYKTDLKVPTLDEFVLSTKPPSSEAPPPYKKVVNLREDYFREKGVTKKKVIIQ